MSEPLITDLQCAPMARLAAIVVAAGDHSLLLVSPPGLGSTMIARRINGLRPDLPQGAIAGEVQFIRQWSRGSVDLADRRPPWRAPHHTASAAGLLGGGKPVRPGEVSLAHRGVLFLDEIAEFSRVPLHAIGQAHADGFVTVGSAKGVTRIPARFALVAATRLCPCGYYGADLSGPRCSCSVHSITRMQARIGLCGVTFDMVVRLRPNDVSDAAMPEAWRPEITTLDHAAIAGRVAQARARLELDTHAPKTHTVADTLAALGVRYPRVLAARLAGDAEEVRRWRRLGVVQRAAEIAEGGAS